MTFPPCSVYIMTLTDMWNVAVQVLHHLLMSAIGISCARMTQFPPFYL